MDPSAFISYSHKDQKWLNKLEVMLRPLVRGGLQVWSDQKIRPGDNWRQSIEAELAKASVAVLLVSPAFLASEFIHDHELPPLLAAARQKGLRILWIPVSQCLYERTPIVDYQAAHPPGKPLDSLKRSSEINTALKQIALAIEAALGQWSGEADHGLASQAMTSHLAALTPEERQRPLAALKESFSHLSMPQISAGLAQAIARCYPGQSRASRYPDYPAATAASGWEVLEAYFTDKGIDSNLQKAWRLALEELEAAADQPDSLNAKTMALVIGWGGDQSPQARQCSYSTFGFDRDGMVYTPLLGLSGIIELDENDQHGVAKAIGALVDQVLMACKDELTQPCVEIFVPWWLIAGAWSGQMTVRDDFDEEVALVHHGPYVIRSFDRIRMNNRLRDLELKIKRLSAGEGCWLPSDKADHPDRLKLVHAIDSLVAVQRPAPPAGGAAEKWLKALLQSRVPLALWPLTEGALQADEFNTCLCSLGLIVDGDPSAVRPVGPDLAAVPRRRYTAQAENQQLSHVHMLLDTPHQPLVVAPAQSPN
jgi:hypothetical protein